MESLTSSSKQVVLSIVPINNSFNLKRTITLNDKQSIDIGRLVEGNETLTSLKFASKVVSRAHARLLFAEGKMFVQDTKSSSGTFLNSTRLSPQGQSSDYVELQDNDTIQLGENYNLNGIYIPCIMMKINFAVFDIGQKEEYVDMSQDPQVQANVDEEFNTVWKHLTSNMKPPLEKLRDFNAAMSPKTADRKVSSATRARRATIVNQSTGLRNNLEPLAENAH